MTIMVIIWDIVTTMGILGVIVGVGILHARYLQWFRT